MLNLCVCVCVCYMQVRRRVAHACKLVEAASMDNSLVAQHMNAAEIQVLR